MFYLHNTCSVSLPIMNVVSQGASSLMRSIAKVNFFISKSMSFFFCKIATRASFSMSPASDLHFHIGLIRSPAVETMRMITSCNMGIFWDVFAVQLSLSAIGILALWQSSIQIWPWAPCTALNRPKVFKLWLLQSWRTLCESEISICKW